MHAKTPADVAGAQRRGGRTSTQPTATGWLPTSPAITPIAPLTSEQDVRSVLLADPPVATRIIAGLGRRLADVEQRLADSVLKSAPQRLAAVLCRLASTAPTGLFGRRPGEIRLTHEQLADLVGTTRETTTKLLGELRDAGLVQLRRGGIVVLDHAELRATAEHTPTRWPQA